MAEFCEFCSQAGGEVLWQDAACRVVLVADPDYPGFCRVIWIPNSVWGERLRTGPHRSAEKSTPRLRELLTAEISKSL